MLRKITETVELGFWKVAIPLMTQSKAIRAVIRTSYKIQNDAQLKKDILLSCVISCASLAFGAAIYSLLLLIA